MQIKVNATGDVARLYGDLRANNPLKKQIDKAKELFESDNNVGNYISKKPWPDKYEAHDIRNLYRFPLSRFYRMIYTVRPD
jgi:3-polyprenyl-4-hydroxybenzoate decarboxylase